MDQMTELQQKLLAEAADVYSGHTIVYGEGDIHAKLMMIGEAPGGDEEKQGRPFVGKAGKNLSSFLEVVGLVREEIYITNVVKLRPTKESPKTKRLVNRPPSKDEIAFFLPYLQQEIAQIAPQWIVTLGNVPLRAVTNDAKANIGDYHGKAVALAEGQKLFPLYHPAAVIYNRDLNEVYQQDLQTLRQALHEGSQV